MLYRLKKFTLPANQKQMTDFEYELAVGRRCKDCQELTEECRCEAIDRKS